MSNALLGVGGLDTQDDGEIRRVLADVRELTKLSRSHLRHENEHMHPALETRAPGSSAVTTEDHAHHEASIDDIDSLASALEMSSRAARDELQRRLYDALGIFVGENLEHMHVEETDNMSVLWATYTDMELHEIEQRLIAAVPSEEMAIFLRWMIAASSPAERAGMLSDMRANAPPFVFQGAYQIAERALSRRDFEKLSNALGVAAA
jgi:hypothetical protein